MSEAVTIAIVTGITTGITVGLPLIAAVILAWLKAQEAKNEVQRVGEVAVLTSQKAESAVAASTKAIEIISVKQDDQHKIMNSRLDEMKKVIAEAAHAEGNLRGRAELQAELDARAVAQAAVAMPTVPLHAPPAVVPPADKPAIPVTIVPASKPLPVKETP